LKQSLVISLFFSLSVLSQPITLLWPIWAIYHLVFFHRFSFKKAIRVLSPALAIMVAIAWINFLYYETSPTYGMFYGKKTNEIHDLGGMILALGHYFFQIFFPYLSSFHYTLAHWSTLLGLPLLVIFLYLIRKWGVPNKVILNWLLFSILPLLVVISKPSLLYDTYLLVPAAGLFLLTLEVDKIRTSTKKTTALMLPLFMAASAFQSLSWESNLSLTQAGFERRPSCKSALAYLKMSYESGILPGRAPRNFIYQNDCEDLKYSGDDLMIVKSYILFYEEDMPQLERKLHLQKLSSYGVFPSLIYAAYLVKMQFLEEARKEMDRILNTWGKINYRSTNIVLIKQTLVPFCIRETNLECQFFLKKFTGRREWLLETD
jgi:hypothetical protein